MFKEVPAPAGRRGHRLGRHVLELMDHHNIEKAMVGVGLDKDHRGTGDWHASSATRTGSSARQRRSEPGHGRGARPREGRTRRSGIKAATRSPPACYPQVPINDKRFYPIYAKCVELDIPIFVCVGVPGPRVPMACQDTS